MIRRRTCSVDCDFYLIFVQARVVQNVQGIENAFGRALRRTVDARAHEMAQFAHVVAYDIALLVADEYLVIADSDDLPDRFVLAYSVRFF